MKCSFKFNHQPVEKRVFRSLVSTFESTKHYPRFAFDRPDTSVSGTSMQAAGRFNTSLQPLCGDFVTSERHCVP